MGDAGYIRLGNFNRGMAPDAVPEHGEVIVAIDRSNPVLGNRHAIGATRDPSARDRAIEAYRRDMDADFAIGGPMSGAVRELAARVQAGERIIASCWCLPRPCHGAVILERVRQVCAELEAAACA
ncbi:MAG: DUF4326 domain-containing protein [Burkholderiales bacterium]|nr:DUF4326 domain-containing protein [Burkholderiales bacterium]